MLLDYAIIKLSESKTIKGAFTDYVITEGEGGISQRLIHDYGAEGGGWPCVDISK